MRITLIFVLFLLSAECCVAFDTETHALITRTAFSRSTLSGVGTDSIVTQLGLDRLAFSLPFRDYWIQFPGDNYYYNGGVYRTSDSGPKWSRPEAFERCQMQEFNRFVKDTPPYNEYGLLFNDTVDSGSPMFTKDTLLPIQNWVVRGAIREDDLGDLGKFVFSSGVHCRTELIWSDQGPSARSLNHFYDPYLDIGLTVPAMAPDRPAVYGGKSVDWALGYVDSFATPPQVDVNRGNLYSYVDARNTFWWALTRKASKQSGVPYSQASAQNDADDRLYLWATTFRALGDVLHLLEDGGQPQHTRNDPHGGPFASDEQKAFEDYTNDRVLGVTDDLNAHVRAFLGDKDLSPPPPLGTYPTATFSTPLRFFTTRNDSPTQTTWAGLADYTNRGFFTGGTLPGELNVAMGFYPLPPQLGSYYGTVSAPCEGILGGDPRLSAVVCKHYTLTVPDVVAPGYADALPAGFSQPPLASESIFTSSSNASVVTLALEELDTIGNMAIPRAVGYATGMLNYFFRATLQVSPPDDGIYAVINHGTPHSVLAGGFPVKSDGTTTFGFEKVRLKVLNTTMADGTGNHTLVESGTNLHVEQKLKATVAGDITSPQLQGPFLVAIARYHRNPCYKPDLSGEVWTNDSNVIQMPSGCTSTASVRSTWPEISVSQSVQIAAGDLDGTQPKLLTFDFSDDPIPVNATDLFIQVAYRGPIGEDQNDSFVGEQDGIAVGSIDVSEPTYLTMFNATDYVVKNGAWQVPQQNDPQPTTLDSISVCAGGSQLYDFSAPSGQGLAVKHVIRTVMLRDQTVSTYSEVASSFFAQSHPLEWNGTQAVDEQGTGYNPIDGTETAMYVGRKMPLGNFGTYFVHCADDCPTTPPGYWELTPDLAPQLSENVGTIAPPGTSCSFAAPAQMAARMQSTLKAASFAPQVTGPSNLQ